MNMFKKLSPEEEADFKKWARTESEEVSNFLKRMKVYHPVVRLEVIDMIKETLEGLKYEN